MQMKLITQQNSTNYFSKMVMISEVFPQSRAFTAKKDRIVSWRFYRIRPVPLCFYSWVFHDKENVKYKI